MYSPYRKILIQLSLLPAFLCLSVSLCHAAFDNQFLTPGSVSHTGGVEFSGSPLISPNWSNLLFRADLESNDVYEVFSVPTCGGPVVKLSPPLPPGREAFLWRVAPNSKLVLYSSDIGSNDIFDLYSVCVTGGASTKLNHSLDPTQDVAHVWFSPDSSNVMYNVFSESSVPNGPQPGYKLYQVPATGGTAQLLVQSTDLTLGLLGGQYTVDQDWFVYNRERTITGGSSVQLFSVSTSGGALNQLNPPLLDNYKGSWHFDVTEDGSKVLFDFWKTNNHAPGVADLYSVSPDGSGLNKIVATSTGGSRVRGAYAFNSMIVSSGETAFFVGNLDDDFQEELYSVPMAGGAPTKLNLPFSAFTDFHFGSAYEVSPDRNRLIYGADRFTNSIHDLYSVSVLGGDTEMLVHDISVFPFRVKFSPDSSKVVYHIGSNAFSVISVTGGVSTILAESMLYAGLPLFSDDSSKVVYSGRYPNDPVSRLYSIGIDGSSNKLVDTRSPVFSHIFVNADGSKVLYITRMREPNFGPFVHTFVLAEPATNLLLSITQYPRFQLLDFLSNSTDIGGVSAFAEGDLTWSNSPNGITGSLPAGEEWNISSIPMSFGTNVFTVTATNSTDQTNVSIQIVRSMPPETGTAVVYFSSALYDVSETSGVASIMIERAGDTQAVFLVDFATVSNLVGRASPVTDYQPTNGTAFFNSNIVSLMIGIPVLDDGEIEDGEFFNVTLSNGVGLVVLSNSALASVVIADNDVPSGDALDEGFEGGAGSSKEAIRGAVPGGWTVIDNYGSTGAVWRFDDPGSRGNLTGGSGAFAIVDPQYEGFPTAVLSDTELQSPVLDLSGFASLMFEFRTDVATGVIETVEVDLSTNGASGPWQKIWDPAGEGKRGPRTESVDISGLADGESNVMIRFHFLSPSAPVFLQGWWQVDEVSVIGIVDADSDGLPDWWETVYFSGDADPDGDDDFDGIRNREERIAGTHPKVADSTDVDLELLSNGAQRVVTINSTPLREYSVDTIGVITSKTWRTVTSGVRGVSGRLELNDHSPTGGPFYRMMITLPAE